VGGQKLPVDYWITGATTLPVLALALIIEVRGMASQLSRLPLIISGIQYFIWATLLSSAGILEMYAFSAIRGNILDRFWSTWLESTVAGFIGALILGPAATYLASGARASWISARYATLRGQITFLRLGRARLEKKKRKLKAELKAMIEYTQSRVDWARTSREDAIDTLLRLDPRTDFEEIADLYRHVYNFENFINEGLAILEDHQLDGEDRDQATTSTSEPIRAEAESFDYRLFERQISS
jgi:hypothetical protein